MKAAGFRHVSFEAAAKKLARYQRDASKAERDALDMVENALDRVRKAYLEQRFDDMLIALAPLEGDALDILAQPAHRAVLWRVEFLLGLAYLSRNHEGDDELTRERFSRAITIDPKRRPDVELYGPDVAAAFARVLAARSTMVARPLRISAKPTDARVIIDGVPIVDIGQPVSLLPGTHFVYASAPGYIPNAFTVTVARRGTIEVPLERVRSQDPVERIGPAWAVGDLRPQTASGRAAIRALMVGLKVDVAIVIHAPSGSDTVVARVITSQRASAPISGKNTLEALEAALSRIGRDGRLATRDNAVAEPSKSTWSPKRVPMYRRWWFWLSIGAVSGVAFITVRQARNEESRLRVLAP